MDAKGREFPCPCGNRMTQVIDSRMAPEGGRRRRRQCTACGSRFTTMEVMTVERGAGDGRAMPMDEFVRATRRDLANALHRLDTQFERITGRRPA